LLPASFPKGALATPKNGDSNRPGASYNTLKNQALPEMQGVPHRSAQRHHRPDCANPCTFATNCFAGMLLRKRGFPSGNCRVERSTCKCRLPYRVPQNDGKRPKLLGAKVSTGGATTSILRVHATPGELRISPQDCRGNQRDDEPNRERFEERYAALKNGFSCGSLYFFTRCGRKEFAPRLSHPCCCRSYCCGGTSLG
jgi:hypothetical protein